MLLCSTSLSQRESGNFGKEVVFPTLDALFCCIVCMFSSWCKLIFYLLFCHIRFENLGAFIVDTLELGLETSRLKESKCRLVRFEKL
jgi:hypothetical protein